MDAPAGTGDTRIVGREAELAAVRAFFEPDHPVAAFLLEGAAGIGKTTLWQAGVDAAVANGYRVLVSRPSGAEAQLSFSSLGDLLANVGDTALAVLPEPQRHALDIALLLAEPGPVPPDRRALGLAVRGVLDQLARSQRVLIAIDDIQWLDRPSAGALEYALRRLEGDAVRVLASLRRASAWEQPSVLGALGDERLQRLAVVPLAPGAVHELVRDRLDLVLPRPLLARVHESSGGNPFFALEIARALRGVTLEPGRPLPLPSALQDAVSARLDRLSAHAREALLVCSALTSPTEGVVAAALGDADDAARGLEEAAAAGVVELGDERIRFEHPLLASTCYSTASGIRRRRLHRTLAGIVDDLEERARHLALAAEGPDDDVARALDQGAELAWSRAAPEAAAELAEQSLALTPALDSDGAHRRRLRAARYRFEAGDAPRAVALLEEALAAAPADDPNDRRAETLLQLGSVKAQTEGLEAGIELYRTALETARNDVLVGRTHEALALAHADAIQLTDARRHAYAAIAAAERLDDTRPLVRSLAAAAYVETISGSDEAEPLLARAVELETLADAVWNPKPARMVHALRLVYTDRVDEARATLEELRGAAAAARAPSEQVFLSYLSLVERRAGHFGAALQRAEAAYALAEQTGRESTKPLALHLKAQALAHIGLADEARTIASDVLVLAAETGQHYRLGLVDQGMLGFLELSLGDSRRAVEYLDPAAELLHELGLAEPALFTFLPDAIEALIELGRLERAAELLDRLEGPARRLQRGWALLAATRCRGLLAAAEGDGVAAEAAFAESLAIHDRLPTSRPFELARTLLARGRVARRAKRRAAARDDLTRALELFDQLGAALWAERAAAELARIPGRMPASDELTETERQVAVLVALGLSNKEVAAKLYVSVRAVESNLTKTYGKLGIRSRTELARLHSEGALRG